MYSRPTLRKCPPNGPLHPPSLSTPLPHSQCSLVTLLPLNMPECQPNLSCSLLLYPLGFYHLPHHSSASIPLFPTFSPLFRSYLIPQNLPPTQPTICPQSAPVRPHNCWSPAPFCHHASSFPLVLFCLCSFLCRPCCHSLSPLFLSLSHCTPILLPFLFFCLPIQWLSSFFPHSPVWRGCLVHLNAAWETWSPASFRCHYWNTTQSDRQTQTQHAMPISTHATKHAHKPTHVHTQGCVDRRTQ